MSTVLPNECLQEIFNSLDKDLYTLHSAILVSRTWCENAIPILWRRPLRYNSQRTKLYLIVPIFLSFLSPEKKGELQLDNSCSVKLPTTNSFYYPSFMRHLDFNNLILAVTEWISKYPPISEMSQLYYKRTKKEISIDYVKRNDLVMAILNVIITISENIEVLMMNMDKNLDTNVYDFFKNDASKFFATPEVVGLFSRLVHFECGGNAFLSEILSELSNYARDLISLSFRQGESSEDRHKDLVALVRSQNNLKCLKLEWFKNENTSHVLKALSGHTNSLEEFTMINGYVSDVEALGFLTRCPNIVQLHFQGQHFTTEQISPLYDAKFPKLESLQFVDLEDRRDYTNPYIRLFQNTGITSNLRNLCLRVRGVPQHSTLLECISHICHKFTSFTTHITRAEDEKKILSILRNAKNLERLEILADDDDTREFREYDDAREFREFFTISHRREAGSLLLEMAKVFPSSLCHLNLTQFEICKDTFESFMQGCEVKLESLIFSSSNFHNSRELIKKLSEKKGWRIKEIESHATKVSVTWDED
ncbi:2565_t:CDS:1 [Acaulospora morrowiae]|uniref:2565_t:CDS:1 n=1 Tax=Acaulospora morrowiae TaxID=94023 RepID=A0A9N8V212_9GLOM|nr:2565_t:CDS:1 [Acaulospora morrowiae]